MAPRRIDPADIASALPPGGRTLVGRVLRRVAAARRSGDARRRGAGGDDFHGYLRSRPQQAHLSGQSALPGRDVLPDAGAEGGGRRGHVPAALLRRHPRAAAQGPDRRGAVHGDAAGPRTGSAASVRSSIFSPTSGRRSRSASRISIRICRACAGLPAFRFPNSPPVVEQEQPLLGIGRRGRGPDVRGDRAQCRALDRRRRHGPGGARQDTDRRAAGAVHGGAVCESIPASSAKPSSISRRPARWPAASR